MRARKKELGIAALILFSSQLLRIIPSLSPGSILLIGIIGATTYLTYKNHLKIKESLLATSTFILSGLGISAVSKTLFYDKLCSTAKSMNAANTEIGSIISEEQACQTTFELFLRLTNQGLIRGWKFWITTLLLATTSIYLYRKFSGQS